MSAHEIALSFEWLYSTLSGDSTLAGYAPGGVFRSLAPPTTATPFVIMSYQSGLDSLTMNAVRMMSELLFLAKAVGPATSMAGIVNAASQIDVLLKRTSGTTVDGLGAILACYREQPLEVDEIVNGELWTNIGGLYRLQIEQIS